MSVLFVILAQGAVGKMCFSNSIVIIQLIIVKMVAYYRYYPHHFAPYMSDLKDFTDLQLTYDRGEPFLPFEQLLAVLPPASKDHLPEAYWVRFVSYFHNKYFPICC